MLWNRKYWIFTLSSIACTLFASCLFFLLCWTAAADAQGAIAFVVYAPVLMVLLFGGYQLGKLAAKEKRVGNFGLRLSQILSILILVFYLSPFIGMGKFSSNVIQFVAQTFEKMTGKSPMQWDRGL